LRVSITRTPSSSALDWLRDKKAKWILILDNVDNAGFLLEAERAGKKGAVTSADGRTLQPLIAYIPQSQNGSILITTRTKEIALKLVEESDIITVNQMEEAHALALFEKKLGTDADGDDICELATALEYMPLAIIQAVAYIS
jgi:hypothetical protein